MSEPSFYIIIHGRLEAEDRRAAEIRISRATTALGMNHCTYAVAKEDEHEYDHLFPPSKA